MSAKLSQVVRSSELLPRPSNADPDVVHGRPAMPAHVSESRTCSRFLPQEPLRLTSLAITRISSLMTSRLVLSTRPRRPVTWFLALG